MISNKASLVTRLGWVIKDVEQLIELARQALDKYLQDSDSDNAENLLQDSANLIEEVQGTLDLVGADGAAMLARETALLARALQAGETNKIEESKQALVEALIRLPEYLNHIEEGYADLPVIILPLLNDLRAARDAELLSEHLVFLPEAGAINNDDIGTNEYIPLDAENLQKACLRLRFHFQKSLLAWYKEDGDSQQGLQTLQRVSKNLIRLNESIRLRSLWWIVIALAEAIENNKLDSSITVKLLMGRMEREIRLFGEVQEVAHNEIIPDELLKNLLYYVGIAESGGETLDAVKKAYLLDLHLPQGETLEELREYYSAPGRELWKSVADSLNENITLIIKGIEALDTDEAVKPQLLPLSENMDKLVGTLSVIGLNQAASIIGDLSDSVARRADKDKHLGKKKRLKTAETLLKLQDVLAEYAKTGNDITDEVFSGSIGINAETIKQTQDAIIEDIQAAQESVTEFVGSDAAYFRLDDAIQNLSNAKGAFVFLSYGDFIPLLDAIVLYLHDDLREKKRLPKDQEQAYLADALTVLEASVKSLQQNEDYTGILSSGYDAIKHLEALSRVQPLIEESQRKEINAQLAQKKKKFQKTPPAILKKLKTL